MRGSSLRGGFLLLLLGVVMGGCAFFQLGAPVEGGFVAKHGKLRVEGIQLVDSHGEAIQLRGVSLFWIL